MVLVLVVAGQKDDTIVGTNMLKYVLKNEKDYWKLISSNTQVSSEGQQFLEMMASLTRWRGEGVPEKVGTVKLTQAVTLLPKQEYLLWGRLPSNVPKSTMEHSYCGAYHLQVCASGHHGGESGHAAVGRWLDPHENHKHLRQTTHPEKEQQAGRCLSLCCELQLVTLLEKYQDVFSKHNHSRLWRSRGLCA